MKTQSKFNLLLVEDNSADVELMKLLFNQSKTPLSLSIAYDGAQGSDFLFRRGEYAQRPNPDLILMDLNLPKKDGRELLIEIKADATLRRIPVILISTSNNMREIDEVYSRGAAAFISKPADFDKFQKTIDAIIAFWLTSAILPSAAR